MAEGGGVVVGAGCEAGECVCVVAHSLFLFFTNLFLLFVLRLGSSERYDLDPFRFWDLGIKDWIGLD